MEVVSIKSKSPKARMEAEQKAAMLEVLENIKEQIEAGTIAEFVACSVDQDGIAQIHVAAMDMPGAVGMYEIGKHLLINDQTLF
jgi:hypothetical protein